MAIACAEADAALIATLRSRFGAVVAMRGAPEAIREGDGPTLYLITLDSPLISEDTPQVEIVLEIEGLRFKAWRDV
jgi:hypothetical protein